MERNLPLQLIRAAVQLKLNRVETFLTSGCWHRLEQIIFGKEVLR
jgi:hypothetical protein